MSNTALHKIGESITAVNLHTDINSVKHDMALALYFLWEYDQGTTALEQSRYFSSLFLWPLHSDFDEIQNK